MVGTGEHLHPAINVQYTVLFEAFVCVKSTDAIKR